MSLIGTLQVGKSALAVQQAALQVTGNNIANAGNADYTRQVARLSPIARSEDSAGHVHRHGRRSHRHPAADRRGARTPAAVGGIRQPVRRHHAAVARRGSSRPSTNCRTRISRRRCRSSSTPGRTWRTSRRTSACARSCCRTARPVANSFQTCATSSRACRRRG